VVLDAQAYFLVLLFAGLVVSLAVEYRLWKGGYDPHGRTSLQVAALVWWFLLLAWLTVWATLYLTPQLL
jgi:heme/copper-type cytochrome/quinol oxidase subunit 3